MKAASGIMSAIAAVAMAVGVALTGSVAVQMATVTTAEAAVVRNIEVRGNRRVDCHVGWAQHGAIRLPRLGPRHGDRLLIPRDHL